MFSGVATVIFAFVGAEIVTIAAAESNEPGRNVARATNAVIYRVLLFYVVSVFFVAAIVPWNTAFTEDIIKSPFTLAFERMGIPGAGTLMNFVVLTAVLSVLNSSLYTTSRMLFALTRHNDAPRFMTNTTSARRADLGDPHRDHLRVRLRRDLLLLPRRGLHVADQRLRRHRALRLPPDRRLGARDAPSPGARGARERCS